MSKEEIPIINTSAREYLLKFMQKNNIHGIALIANSDLKYFDTLYFEDDYMAFLMAINNLNNPTVISLMDQLRVAIELSKLEETTA